MLLTLREGCDSVRPGLDLGPDRFVRIGLERNTVTGESENGNQNQSGRIL